MSDATYSTEEVTLWPYVLQFSLVYLVASAAAAAVILASGWQGNSGVNIGILVASVVLPMHMFARDQKRPLTRREQLRFAALALVASSVLGLAVTAVAVAAFVGPEYVVSWVSGWEYVAPGYLVFIGVMLVVTCLVILAVLYFVSGLLSRAFHRQLARRGAL